MGDQIGQLLDQIEVILRDELLDDVIHLLVVHRLGEVIGTSCRFKVEVSSHIDFITASDAMLFLHHPVMPIKHRIDKPHGSI